MQNLKSGSLGELRTYNALNKHLIWMRSSNSNLFLSLTIFQVRLDDSSGFVILDFSAVPLF